MVSNFSDYCRSSLENANTFAIEMRGHFTVSATERCSSNLYLAAINEMNAFLVTFQGSSSQL